MAPVPVIGHGLRFCSWELNCLRKEKKPSTAGRGVWYFSNIFITTVDDKVLGETTLFESEPRPRGNCCHVQCVSSPRVYCRHVGYEYFVVGIYFSHIPSDFQSFLLRICSTTQYNVCTLFKRVLFIIYVFRERSRTFLMRCFLPLGSSS